LREERRLRVVKKRVLGRILGPKRGEVKGECSRLHNGELYDPYSSPNIIQGSKQENEMGGAGSTYGGDERCIKDFGEEELTEGNHMEGPGVDGRIILK
jgi:hypothetical protein